MNKKADILHEQVIFIVLNVVFFSVMLLFIYLQSSSVHLTEEETAKQVALIIDASRPETTIEINLKDFFETAEKNGVNKESSIQIDKDKNLVITKLSEDTFYEYSYFNDVQVANSKSGDGVYFVLEIKEKPKQIEEEK